MIAFLLLLGLAHFIGFEAFDAYRHHYRRLAVALVVAALVAAYLSGYVAVVTL